MFQNVSGQQVCFWHHEVTDLAWRSFLAFYQLVNLLFFVNVAQQSEDKSNTCSTKSERVISYLIGASAVFRVFKSVSSHLLLYANFTLCGWSLSPLCKVRVSADGLPFNYLLIGINCTGEVIIGLQDLSWCVFLKRLKQQSGWYKAKLWVQCISDKFKKRTDQKKRIWPALPKLLSSSSVSVASLNTVCLSLSQSLYNSWK